MKKNYNKYIRYCLATFAVVLSLVFAAGCKKNNDNYDPNGKPVTDNVSQDGSAPGLTDIPAPTATPKPTPIVDVPADRFDALATPRSEEDEVPVVYERENLVSAVNPFFGNSETGKEINDLVNVTLLNSGAEKSMLAGINYPCIAYEVEKIDNTSEFSGNIESVPDGYSLYRIALKEGISFTNGEPITSADVLFCAHILSTRLYDGPYSLSDVDIPGMQEYHTQIPGGVKEKAEKMAAAGINSDGTCPANVDEAEWKDVWQYYDEAGTAFCEDAIEAVINQYCEDPYVWTFLSTSLTAEQIKLSESLRTLFAMRMIGVAYDFSYKNNTFKDSNDVIRDLNEEELTAASLWELLDQLYKYDFSENFGLNYEHFMDDKLFEDYLVEAYCNNNMGVSNISGLAAGVKIYPDGGKRSYIDVLLGSQSDISDFNFYVVPSSVYRGDAHSDLAVGAGQYMVVSVTEDEIKLEANDGFMLGSPVKKFVTFTRPEEGTEPEGEENEENN